MKEPIIISVQYSAEDYARAAKYVQQRKFIAKYAFLAPLVVLSLVLLFLYSIDRFNFERAFASPNKLFVLLFMLILTPLLYFLRRRKYSFSARRQFRKQIESSPALQQPQVVIFDDEGIEGKTLLSSGTIAWEAIIEATETKDDFYFFTAKTFAIFVPKSAFESQIQQNELLTIAREKLGVRAEGLRSFR